jgi:hypothetical protein
MKEEREQHKTEGEGSETETGGWKWLRREVAESVRNRQKRPVSGPEPKVTLQRGRWWPLGHRRVWRGVGVGGRCGIGVGIVGHDVAVSGRWTWRGRW